MSTILRTPAAASGSGSSSSSSSSLHAEDGAQISALGWKHEQAKLAALDRKRKQRRKKASPRVPDFLHHLPRSTCDALMQSADHIDHCEKAKALATGAAQTDHMRALASGSGSRPRSGASSTGSVQSSSSGGSQRRGRRRQRRLESLSAPDLGGGGGEAQAPARGRGSVGEFEIRPHGARGDTPDVESVKRAEERRQRRERREAQRNMALKDAARVGLPPINPVAGGSITMTVGANGKEGTANLVGREASELADLGGLISPSTIESFDFSTAFMTPEMMEEKQQRRAHLRKAMRTARMTSAMIKTTRDKQQSQALSSFLGGMKSRTRVKGLVNRHVRDENRRLFATAAH